MLSLQENEFSFCLDIGRKKKSRDDEQAKQITCYHEKTNVLIMA